MVPAAPRYHGTHVQGTMVPGTMTQTQTQTQNIFIFGLKSNIKYNSIYDILVQKKKEMIDIQDQGPTQRQCYVVIVWAPGE